MEVFLFWVVVMEVGSLQAYSLVFKSKFLLFHLTSFPIYVQYHHLIFSFQFCNMEAVLHIFLSHLSPHLAQVPFCSLLRAFIPAWGCFTLQKEWPQYTSPSFLKKFFSLLAHTRLVFPAPPLTAEPGINYLTSLSLSPHL